MLYIYKAEFGLSDREVASRLAENVSRRPWFGVPDTLFEGKVTGHRFRILRVARGRNSFNPMLFGSIVPTAAGSRVNVVMTLHPVVVLLMVVWSVTAGWDGIAHGSSGVGRWAFVAAPWLIGIPFFFYDAARSRDLLQRCLSSRSCLAKPGSGQ